MSLAGRSAIVTGASRGIGRAIALDLAAHGVRVAVNYRADEGAAEEVVATIAAAGGEAIAVQADVRELDAAKGLVERAVEAYGGVDILVNNAGIVRDKPVAFLTPAEWRDVLDTNLTGAFHAVKIVARLMARQRRGAIVNISSAAGLVGDANRANYSAAKAGLNGFTKAIARELAASGVRVNAVAPGIVDTDLLKQVPAAKREAILKQVPMARPGAPDEVAGVVRFLVSDASAYMTGQIVSVDGGLCM